MVDKLKILMIVLWPFVLFWTGLILFVNGGLSRVDPTKPGFQGKTFAQVQKEAERLQKLKSKRL